MTSRVPRAPHYCNLLVWVLVCAICTACASAPAPRIPPATGFWKTREHRYSIEPNGTVYVDGAVLFRMSPEGRVTDRHGARSLPSFSEIGPCWDPTVRKSVSWE